MKSFERNRRFFVAVLLAAIYGMSRFTWREIFAALKMLLVALTSKKGSASDDLYNERFEKTCKKCPIFFTPLATCGSPFLKDPDVGCWCSVERKARVKEAKCWLRENTDIDSGWIE